MRMRHKRMARRSLPTSLVLLVLHIFSGGSIAQVANAELVRRGREPRTRSLLRAALGSPEDEEPEKQKAPSSTASSSPTEMQAGPPAIDEALQHPRAFHAERVPKRQLSQSTSRLGTEFMQKRTRSGIVEELKVFEQLDASLSTEAPMLQNNQLPFQLPESEYRTLLTDFVENQASRYIGDDGNGDARKFIKDHYTPLESLSGISFTVEEQPFQYSSEIQCANVVAKLAAAPGFENEPVIVVGAHYDSRPFGPVAPGADDNGTGSAAVMLAADKTARYFSAKVSADGAGAGPRAPMYFVHFSAEEQGLNGSAAFATKLKTDNIPVKQALILDQVGYQTNPSGPNGFIFETTGSSSDPQQHLMNLLGELSTRIVPEAAKLDRQVNYHGWGSDHISMLNAGFPAVLLIERDNLHAEDLFGHTVNDDLSHISWPFATKIAKLATYTAIALASEGGAASASGTSASGGTALAETSPTVLAAKSPAEVLTGKSPTVQRAAKSPTAPAATVTTSSVGATLAGAAQQGAPTQNAVLAKAAAGK